MLHQRCEEIDRDPSTLATSYLTSVALAETQAEADALLARVPEDRRAQALIGTPEVIARPVSGMRFWAPAWRA